MTHHIHVSTHGTACRLMLLATTQMIDEAVHAATFAIESPAKAIVTAVAALFTHRSVAH